MQWLDFTQLVEIPAFLGLVAAIVWVYGELKGEIKRILSQHNADFNKVAQQRESDRLLHQDWLIDVIKHYVPKEDVVRLEERILEAISRLESMIDRQRSSVGA